MVFRLLADLVVVLHFAFIVFVAAGGLLVWRCPWLVRLHLPAVVWAIAIITVGFTCPLTPLETQLRGRAGEQGYDGGFVDDTSRASSTPVRSRHWYGRSSPRRCSSGTPACSAGAVVAEPAVQTKARPHRRAQRPCKGLDMAQMDGRTRGHGTPERRPQS
jgi:Protein of Unknown function (DUF2784)